jgi:flagellin-like protein
MMMRGKGIVPVLGSVLLLALVVVAGVLAFNAGAAQGAIFGMQMAPVLAGLLAVILLLFALRLAAPLLLWPLFGIGLHRWRHHGFGRGWGPWACKGYGRGWRSPRDWEDHVPPMVAEWHRRLHEIESEGDEPTGTSV